VRDKRSYQKFGSQLIWIRFDAAIKFESKEII